VSRRGRVSGPSRYGAMFAALASRGEGAVVPFTVLGDPDAETSLAVLRTLVAAGADAVELGVPFSDPIADGPVIQAGVGRALGAGATVASCWRVVSRLRSECADLPIGVLTYANLVVRAGVGGFYAAAAEAGADSVLVADVPLEEAQPFRAAAEDAGIAFVAMVPHDATPAVVEAVARGSRGYTYVVSRPGVTGADAPPRHDARGLLARLRAAGAAPPLLGFGIGSASQVREALAAGAAGVFCGSAIVERVGRLRNDNPRALEDLGALMRRLKGASRTA
jgi:tryptophan synthase alpha chain